MISHQFFLITFFSCSAITVSTLVIRDSEFLDISLLKNEMKQLMDKFAQRNESFYKKLISLDITSEAVESAKNLTDPEHKQKCLDTYDQNFGNFINQLTISTEMYDMGKNISKMVSEFIDLQDKLLTLLYKPNAPEIKINEKYSSLKEAQQNVNSKFDKFIEANLDNFSISVLHPLGKCLTEAIDLQAW